MTNEDRQLLTIAVQKNIITLEQSREIAALIEDLARKNIQTSIKKLMLQKGYLSLEKLRILNQLVRTNQARAMTASSPDPPGTTPDYAHVRSTAGQPGSSDVIMKEPPHTRVKSMEPCSRSLGQAQPSSSTPQEKQAFYEVVPGYRLIEKIGAGGISAVFRAQDTRNFKSVAVKIMFPQHAKNELYVKRFLREADLLIKFDHPNIVKGIERGQSRGLYYFVMEFIPGESIFRKIQRDGPLDEDAALDAILQIASALDYLQSQQIVHRDIKPDNVLIAPDGLVKLIDLGFAKPIGSTEESHHEFTVGTPQYMSPEQARGVADLDMRSDIYSLGASLYHMVTGVVPFTGADNMEVMAKQVLEDLQSTHLKDGKITPHIYYFIEKMMAKEADIRYQTPREVIEDIERQRKGWKALEFDPSKVEADFFRRLNPDAWRVQAPGKRTPGITERSTMPVRRDTDRKTSRFFRLKRDK